MVAEVVVVASVKREAAAVALHTAETIKLRAREGAGERVAAEAAAFKVAERR